MNNAQKEVGLMQQILLTMIAENEQIPIEYNSAILSYIKSAIQSYSSEIYEQWYGKNSVKRKTYTYSVSFSRPQFSENFITVEDTKFKLYLSCYDLGEFITLYNAFLKKRGELYPLKNNSITLDNLALMNIPYISGNSVMIKVDSPIIARNHTNDNKDKFFVFNDESFYSSILNTVKNSIKNTCIDISGFSLTPVDAKKTVIHHYGMRINANIGTYCLTGSPELLNYLLLSGIGSATNSGHGKFHIIRG